ncbi:MAG TPA: methyltransferase domain-containing protein [Gaiellaceae bacterium]|nr:methyltransferase domain-containing protein [Gaiellaceae bacterium]
MLLDHLEGRAGEPELERDDGHIGPAVGAEWFFAAHDAWVEEERAVFELVRGRVLDIGTGAGRHSLEAQRRGLETVAIDISPGAVEVCRRRGVRDPRLLPLGELNESLGVFDTILLLCGNLGLAGGGSETVALLEKLRGLTTPGARIVFDSVNPHAENDEADIAYLERNREGARMPGQVTIRIRYRGLMTPWYDLLCVSPEELEELATPSGWRLAWRRDAEPSDWYGVLEKS